MRSIFKLAQLRELSPELSAAYRFNCRSHLFQSFPESGPLSSKIDPDAAASFRAEPGAVMQQDTRLQAEKFRRGGSAGQGQQP
jgi:hypothetical protein